MGWELKVFGETRWMNEQCVEIPACRRNNIVNMYSTECKVIYIPLKKNRVILDKNAEIYQATFWFLHASPAPVCFDLGVQRVVNKTVNTVLVSKLMLLTSGSVHFRNYIWMFGTIMASISRIYQTFCPVQYMLILPFVCGHPFALCERFGSSPSFTSATILKEVCVFEHMGHFLESIPVMLEVICFEN